MTGIVEAKKEVQPVQVTVDQNLSTATLGGTKIEISPEGNVVAFTDKGVQVKPAAATTAAATEDKQISIGNDFNTVAMYGATVELAADGSLIVSTNGNVTVKPAAANDTAIAAAKAALEPGAKMADGSIFAGLTDDGKQQIFAMPADLSITLTFNDAAKVVKNLNADKALGQDDWQIPSLENARVLYKNKNEGALKGTFNTSGNKGSVSDCPDWYWSSTKPQESYLHNVRFLDGFESWDHMDNRLRCRPVRLVEVPRL